MSPTPIFTECAAVPLLPVVRQSVHEMPGPVECRVCMGDHDAQIHAATMSVHVWFRGEVLKPFIYQMLDDPEFRAMIEGLVESGGIFDDSQWIEAQA